MKRGAGHWVVATACAAWIGCAEDTVSSESDSPAPTQDATSETTRGATPNRILLGRIEGGGDPVNGVLWSRPVAEVEPRELPDGVAVNAAPLLGAKPGYCNTVVASDDDPDTNPPGTFQYFTLDRDGTRTIDPDDDSSFVPDDCYPRLDPSQQNATHDALFYGITGVGCALQHVGNFTSATFDHVYLDVDQFQGEEALQTPYGSPYTTGTVVTPTGRNPPNQVLGLWDYGSFTPGQMKEMWLFFKNGASTAFTFQGSLVAEVREDCGAGGTGNGVDEDCDSVVDNGCGAFAYGQPCFLDVDCVGGTCEGELLVSGFGAAGQELGNDKAGTCTPPCGDNVVQGMEQCDDGNATPGDGCEPGCVLPPDCAAAIGPIGYGTVSGTTVGRGNQRAGSCSQGAGEELIYEFVAPATETVCIDTFGSTYDTQLYVQTTCGVSATEVACNDDVTFDDVRSQLELLTTVGETYWIVVDGWSSSGDYDLNIASGACSPVCGDYLCELSEDCVTCPFDCGPCPDCGETHLLTDYGTFTEPIDGHGPDQYGSCGPSGGEDAVIEFVAPSTGTVCAHSFGSTFDTELYVRTDCFNPGSELDCNEDAGGTHSMIEFPVTSGNSYYIFVDSPAPASGDFSVTVQAGACPVDFCAGNCAGGSASGCWCDVSCITVGDCCPDACATCGNCNDCSPPLTTTGYGTYTGTTATNGDQQAGLCTGGAGADVIYQFVAPATGPVCIDTFGSAFDTQLHVQDSCGAGAIACNDDVDSAVTYESRIEISVAQSESYYIVADGYGVGDEGNYTLHINDGPCCPPGTIDLGTSCETVAQVSTGYIHTCAVTTNGKLYCWGDNTLDQLGDGGVLGASAIPVRVGTATNWNAVSAGWYHSCALNASGEVYCWGDNTFGQTGTGNPLTTRAVPTLVGTGFIAVDVGNDHSCAITSGGAMNCWGRNANGQLGDMSTAQKTTPVVVNGGGTYVVVSAGGLHTCGRRTDGTLWCWGSNGNGRLGDGTTTQRTVPTQVTQAPANTWQDVSAGQDHTCGTRGGSLYCWGANATGQLGDSSTMQRTSPVPVGAAMDWEAVRSGYGFTCGRRNVGGTEQRLFCWGYNAEGEVGDATFTQRLVPTETAGAATNWQAFSAGVSQACGIRAGALHCWGWDGIGQLGDDVYRRTPVETHGAFSTWTAHSAGKWHGCGIRGGQIYCWGDNTYGQLGNGTTTFSAYAVLVTGGFSDWQSVSVGAGNTCAVRAGLAYCWGFNGNGRLGDGTTVDKTVPTLVTGGYTDWQSISMGESHACGVRGGRVMCWGFGGSGQLGNGGTTSSSMPVENAGGLTGWTMVDAGTSFTCGVRSGVAHCWGFNGNGELGDGTVVNKLVPTPVFGGLGDWLTVSTGPNGGACGHRSSGEVRCWGFNGNGQLGDGTLDSHLTPEPILAPGTAWQSVVMGYSHACGIRGGRMYCWGYGAEGALGYGSLGQRTAPSEAAPWATDWQDVSTYEDSVCGRRSGGRLYCWGSDVYAQLGSLPVNIPRPIEGPK